MSLFPGALFPNPNIQWFDDDGAPLAGGKLYFFITQTSTPEDTFAQSDLDPLSVNTNPIILNASGRADVPIFLNPIGYTVTLTDADDVEIWSRDDIEGDNVFPATWGNLLAEGSKSVTTGYTVLDTDRLVTVNSASGVTTVNLLPAGDATQPLTIKNVSTHIVNVTPDGTDTLEGTAAAYAIPAVSGVVQPAIMLVSDGVSAWYITASHGL